MSPAATPDATLLSWLPNWSRFKLEDSRYSAGQQNAQNRRTFPISPISRTGERPLFPETDICRVKTSLPIYTDPGGGFLKRVRKLVTPAVYWIDEKGTVRYARTGPRGAREEEVMFRRALGRESN
jgi:hypothetical protein